MSAAAAAAAAAACCSSRNTSHSTAQNHQYSAPHRQNHRRQAVLVSTLCSRYESLKRREWMSFLQYLRERRPAVFVSGCSGAHVVEFLRYYVAQNNDVSHTENCPLLFGQSDPCPCPARQVYWGSVDAVIGRLRAAFEEVVGHAWADTTTNPFGAAEVMLYLRQLKEAQLQQHQ